MDSMAYLGVVFMKRSMVRGLFLALCLLPAAAGAADGGNGGVPDRNEDRGIQFSSAFSSVEKAGESESTLYFNDGFGRMTEFHMVSDNHVMTVTIRQNMRIVWKGSCHVKMMISPWSAEKGKDIFIFSSPWENIPIAAKLPETTAGMCRKSERHCLFML